MSSNRELVSQIKIATRFSKLSGHSNQVVQLLEVRKVVGEKRRITVRKKQKQIVPNGVVEQQSSCAGKLEAGLSSGAKANGGSPTTSTNGQSQDAALSRTIKTTVLRENSAALIINNNIDILVTAEESYSFNFEQQKCGSCCPDAQTDALSNCCSPIAITKAEPKKCAKDCNSAPLVAAVSADEVQIEED